MVLIAVGQAGRESPLEDFFWDQSSRINNPFNNNYDQVEATTRIWWRQAGRELPLTAFFGDHIRRINNSFNNIVKARTRIWLRLTHFIGVAMAIGLLGSFSWKNTFAISTIVMVVALLMFLMGRGFKKYQPKCVTGSILTIVYRVFKNGIKRRSIIYSDNPDDYYKNDHSDKLPLMPQMLFINWIDKAAIKGDTSTLSVEVQEEKGKLCTVTQVKEVKSLLTMIPMWASFFMYCLVITTGNTFFIEPTSNLNTILLIALQRFLKYMASSVCNRIINKWFNKKKLLAMKVRIGIGLACSCLCCIVARLVEVKRLDKVTKKEFIDQENKIIGMSIFWLVPQFGLLGLTEGLTEDGLSEFFCYQVAESMKEYGPQFNEFVLGIGKFISIFWVLTFKDWIGDDINVSHLDNYYGILAICSMGNLFFIYGSISTYFYKHAKEEDITSMELVGELQQRTTD